MIDLFTTTAVFMEGATTCGYLCAAIFFLRFWRRTGDRLFAHFATAFLLIAVNHAVITLWDIPGERAYYYLPRLAAFLLIIWAIVDKNLVKAKPTNGRRGVSTSSQGGADGR